MATKKEEEIKKLKTKLSGMKYRLNVLESNRSDVCGECMSTDESDCSWCQSMAAYDEKCRKQEESIVIMEREICKKKKRIN